MAKYSEFKYSQAPYGERIRVYKQFTMIWNLFANIGKEFTMVWNLFKNIYQTYTLKWNILIIVYREFTIKWNLFKNIYQEFTIKWNIFNKVYQTYTFLWTLYAEISKLLRIKWDLRSVTGLYFAPIPKPSTGYNSINEITTNYDGIQRYSTDIWTKIKTSGHKYGTFKYGTKRYGRIAIDKIVKPTTNYNNITNVNQ